MLCKLLYFCFRFNSIISFSLMDKNDFGILKSVMTTLANLIKVGADLGAPLNPKQRASVVSQVSRLHNEELYLDILVDSVKPIGELMASITLKLKEMVTVPGAE